MNDNPASSILAIGLVFLAIFGAVVIFINSTRPPPQPQTLTQRQDAAHEARQDALVEAQIDAIGTEAAANAQATRLNSFLPWVVFGSALVAVGFMAITAIIAVVFLRPKPVAAPERIVERVFYLPRREIWGMMEAEQAQTSKVILRR